MDNQLNLLNIQSKRISISDPSAIACCSRYRECSNSKQCVIPDLDYAKNCIYRKNLENGQIFYGKNANEFSTFRYEEIKDCLSIFSQEALSMLDSILLNLCELNRGASSCIIRNKYIPDLDSLKIFDICKLEGRFPAICDVVKLRKLVRDDPVYGIMFIEAGKKRNMKRRTEKSLSSNTSREFLTEFLNGQAIELRERLAEPYRFLRIRPEADQYIEELYQERVYPSYDTHVYIVSPLAEDGLLTKSEIQKEYERCNKLSKKETRK